MGAFLRPKLEEFQTEYTYCCSAQEARNVDTKPKKADVELGYRCGI